MYFSKRKLKYFDTFNHYFSEKYSKRANSTNHPVWPLICRNKPAINPKWFNSSDTNSNLTPFLVSAQVVVALLWYPMMMTKKMVVTDIISWLAVLEVLAILHFQSKEKPPAKNLSIVNKNLNILLFVWCWMNKTLEIKLSSTVYVFGGKENERVWKNHMKKPVFSGFAFDLFVHRCTTAQWCVFNNSSLLGIYIF